MSEIKADQPLIELRQVTKVYHGITGEVHALRGVDLKVMPGEFISITGRSGSGKSTLVNMITGIDRLSGGEIWVEGAGLHQMNELRVASWRGRSVGIVFQAFNLMPTLTALQNITLPMEFAGIGTPRQRRERALHLLEMMEIPEHAYKRPSAISGGQQQRVAIARALANDPPLIMADEPTGSLDTATANVVFGLFQGLVDQGKTVMYVTHDEELAERAGRVVLLRDGVVAGERAGTDRRISRQAVSAEGQDAA